LLNRFRLGRSAKALEYFRDFRDNLLSGIQHYAQLAEQLVDGPAERFRAEFEGLRNEIERIPLPAPGQLSNG